MLRMRCHCRAAAPRLWARINYLDPKPDRAAKTSLAAYQGKTYKQVGRAAGWWRTLPAAGAWSRAWGLGCLSSRVDGLVDGLLAGWLAGWLAARSRLL